MPFPVYRPRRLRESPLLRKMVRETTLRLMDLRPTAPYRFYCPQGSKVFDVGDEDIESFTTPTRGTLAGLLDDFRPLAGCRVENAVPQEVAR